MMVYLRLMYTLKIQVKQLYYLDIMIVIIIMQLNLIIQVNKVLDLLRKMRE